MLANGVASGGSLDLRHNLYSKSNGQQQQQSKIATQTHTRIGTIFLSGTESNIDHGPKSPWLLDILQ